MSKKLTGVAIGSAFVATLAAGTANAVDNPFEMTVMDSGYQVAMSSMEGTCGDKGAEGKCGDKKTEGKCGNKGAEGKCGAK